MKDMKAKRAAAFNLALTMLVFSFSSCGNRTDAGTEEKNSTSPAVPQTQEPVETIAETEDIFASYREVDLGGQTVQVSVSSNLADSSTVSSFVYTAGPEELVGEACQDYVYERNLYIQDLLNCGLKYESTDLIYNAVEAYITKLVNSGDSSIQYCINDLLGFSAAAQKGFLLDMSDKSNFDEYYFDFDSGDYYAEYMHALSAGPRVFFAAGDYFIDTLRASHGLYINKNLYGNMYGDPDGIYNLVLERKWTLDQFYEIVNGSYIDANGNGEGDGADTFGCAIATKNDLNSFWPFYYSTDAGITEMGEDGIPVLSQSPAERMSFVAERLMKVQQSPGIWKTGSAGESRAFFVNGSAIFGVFFKLGDMEGEDFRDMDGVGVVPYPMADESQDGYRTLVHDTAELGVMPATVTGSNASAASAVIQAMSIHAHQYLRPLYYETALKQKYSQDQLTAQMLDIIVDGIRAPFEFIYLNSYSYGPVQTSIQQNTNMVASSLAKAEKTAGKMLERLVSALNQ